MNTDEKDMREIKSSKPAYNSDLSDMEELYAMKRKGRNKRSEDIPIDDFLFDEYDETETDADENDAIPEEEPDETDIMQEETEEYEEEAPEEDIAPEPKAAEPVPDTNKKSARPSKKSKKLRKNLGLDDNLTVVDGNHATTEKKQKHYSRFDSYEFKQNRNRAVITVLVTLAVTYGCIYLAVGSINNTHFKEMNTKLSNQKTSSTLLDTNMFYLDSDMDGITDDYENGSFGTDPNSVDTDGDGMTDGEEFLAGTDPLTASPDDLEKAYTRNFSTDRAALSVTGVSAEISSVVMEEYYSQFSGYPGVLSSIYEATGISANSHIDIAVTKDHLSALGCTENNVALFRLNTADMSVSEVPSTYIDEVLSGDISESGGYFAADRTMFSIESGVDVLFLIDNSGSMYSKELVAGSEENDLEFKRIALSEAIIDEFDDNTNCGVAKFTASYMLLSKISNDKEYAKQGLSYIKNGEESFNGTDFAGAITKASEEFTDPTRRRFIVLITDGLPSEQKFELYEQQAIDICEEKNISVIAISLGKETDIDFLTQISEDTNGTFYRALNADSFETIDSKIVNFIYNDKINISTEDGQKITATTIADTGFGTKDCIKAAGIPTNLSESGDLLGSARVNKYYYSGHIPLISESYNISDIEFFRDGKQHIGEYVLACADDYNLYKVLEDKWDFTGKSSSLMFSEDTSEWLAARPFSTILSDFPGHGESSETIDTLRKIALQQLKNYATYENAVIKTEALSQEQQQIFNLIHYYNTVDDIDICSFGIDGNTAFDLLTSELKSGIPSVLATESGKVFNAVRLSRDAENPHMYVLDVIDLNDPLKVNNIILTQHDLYDDPYSSLQFTAEYNKETINLYIIKK